MSQDTAAVESYYYSVGSEVMDRGRGIYLYDKNGRSYIDCAAGTFNLSLGYSHPEVIRAMHEQLDKLVHASSSFQNPPVNDLVQRLVDLSPENLTRVHLKVSGGSVANEGAVKMAQRATGKSEVISLFRSHHGQTMAMTKSSGLAFRKESLPIVGGSDLIVPDPYCYRCFYGEQRQTCGLICVDRIDDFLQYASTGQVACILIEPISGNGGNVVAPPGYLQRLRDFCNERDIILIFDEIQTGIGRLGTMFAADYFGVEPDAITFGKGLGGSGAQVAGILANDRLSGLEGHLHSFTYGANLLAAAAANKTLEIVSKQSFLEHVTATGQHFINRLGVLQTNHPCIGDLRGVGLMIGMEIVNPDGTKNVSLTNEIATRGRDYGLLLRTSEYGRGNVIKVRPALTITHNEVDLICDRLEDLFLAVT